MDVCVERPEEKGALLAEARNSSSVRTFTLSRVKGLALVSFGFFLALYLLLSDCLLVHDGEEDRASSAIQDIASFNLVKHAAPAPSATSSVLECFQVYQPVLTPSEATDETGSSDGFENTTTVASAPAPAGSSCDVLLMEHSFAFSYGMPFVGAVVPPFWVNNIDLSRKLHASEMQV